MACDVRFTQSAKTDIESILSYLETSLKSPQAVSSFLDRLEEIVMSIEGQPESFPTCQEPRLARMEYRKALVGNYILLYRLQDGHAIVAHVFHGSQDYARLV